MGSNSGYIYRCNQNCPIHKHCFIIKTEKPIKVPFMILHKCEAVKRDIRIQIGDDRPP